MHPIPSYDLRHLGFARFAPPPALAAHVQCYWVIRSRSALPASTEKLYPDGGTGLIFNFGSPYTIGRIPVESPLMYQGAGDRAEGMELGGRIDAIGVRFRPAGAYSILGGIPAQELRHSWQPLEQLLPVAAERLFARLADISEPRQRLQMISQWLLHRVDQAARQRASVLPLIDALDTGFAPLAVDGLARLSGLSRRRLERLFSLQAGFAPARLSQLLKVSRARESLKTDFLTPLTDIGQACGFYDQPHFIRQFKAIMQVTPGQYRRHKMAQIYNP